ncbi:PstS family phosphate ABC transporter substrate-binding protein [Streptomyces macrosporus]|uniref:Substrate-binding domain-containing protein n=1 Tax=Streptomyces macrosporus TaxID=44032 RepID=A0ABN3K5U3_9ACTN
MDVFRWEIILAVLGVVVPIAAALYEFVFVGRKRLGYRVQMDTTATDAVHSQYAGALQQLQDGDGTRLVDPSFVLLRVENNGATHIDNDDYAALPDDKVGIRVRFPGRRVAGMVVTELGDDFLRPCFGEDSGLSVRDGVIELPKVPLNRSAHYKVLAALERTGEEENGARAQFAPPEVVGGIKGGVGNGGIQETRSQTGTSWRAIALICFLVLVVLGQLAVSLGEDDTTAPLDCATGTLTITGSSAFKPVLQDATEAYRKTCPGAEFVIRTGAGSDGLETLDREGRKQGSSSPAHLAFTDGEKGEGHPRLLPRPIAFSLFALVVNEEAGVQDLSLGQIERIYAGDVTNWEQLGGNDLPIRLVGRAYASGTRRAFEQKVLGGVQEPAPTSDDCRNPGPGAVPGPVRCERGSTSGLLDAVERIPGALGYSALGEAAERRGLRLVSIGGHRAGPEEADHGAYPFWATEYAHTYGEPPADSLAAGFLRYLTNEVGKDIVRSHGHRPCGELRNPVLCRPTEQARPSLSPSVAPSPSSSPGGGGGRGVTGRQAGPPAGGTRDSVVRVAES